MWKRFFFFFENEVMHIDDFNLVERLRIMTMGEETLTAPFIWAR